MLFDISEAEHRINYVFKNKELLRQAFTHSSYASERNVKSNQRMEYLGDAVLNFIVAESLYRNYPEADEKALTNMRSGIVRKQTLFSAATNLNLEELLLFGEGERKNDKREKILEDLFEAVTGAIYVDGGISAATKFIDFALKNQLNGAPKYKKLDDKSYLSEICQKKYGKKANYVMLKQEGSPHSPQFTVAAEINGITYISATAGSKKEAEQLAAKNALIGINADSKGKNGNRGKQNHINNKIKNKKAENKG